ncbi:MAG: S8 family serine peptidase [Ktedonobacterales bacterium]|nr:S8 family serine peptidase [Ktedonobacterales bacterium]
MKPRVRNFVAVGLVALVVVSAIAAGFVISRSPSKAAAPGNLIFSKHDRQLLATAIINHKSTVTLLVAVNKGTTNQSVITQLNNLGASLKYQDVKARYLRVTVPIGNVTKVLGLGGIQAVGLDDTINIGDPRPATAAISPEAVPNPPPPLGPTTPSANPYMPTQDTGAAQFVTSNPKFDGRGVKVGILDTGVDVFTPELQKAKNLAGTDVRKIIDWKTYTDPVADADPTWISMTTDVTATNANNPTFTFNGVTYKAPYNGKFHLGFFDATDPNLNGDPAEDANLGDQIAALYPATASNIFPVLTSNDGYDVWVDTTQNKNFNDEKDMVEYADSGHFDIGTFGTDRTIQSGHLRQSVPFVVQTDPKNKLVNIGIVAGSHATHVAGIATGRGFFGGTSYNGAAPNAQIISVRVCVFTGNCTSHGLFEGMIYAVRDAGADVVNMSIGGFNPFDDGTNVTEVLYNNLVEEYDVQIFISAGNSGAGLSTAGEPSLASKVISVGASFTADTLLANYGSTTTRADNLFQFSSRGPRVDGGFKPDIVAPGSAVSTIPGNRPGEGLAVALPPGYGMFNGTSMASPQAAGAAALLLSASKQSGVDSHNAGNLRQAIKSTTRYLPGYQAYQQGNGLFNVTAAWNMLKRKHIDAYQALSSVAPVSSAADDFTATPGTGPGIFLREGVKAGDSLSKTVSFRRDDPKGSGSMKYTITLVGNDGTFSAPSSITLPMHTPVSISVGIHPTTAGVHSVIMNLTTPESDGVVYQVLNTVVAAEQFTAASNYATPGEAGSVNVADATEFFYNVPAGATAFQFNVTGITGRLKVNVYDIYGLPIYLAPGYQTGGTLSKTVATDGPGVYEVEVDASRASPVQLSTFTISASVLGATLSPTTWVQDPTTIGTTYSQSFTATNVLASATMGVVGTALGSAEAKPGNFAPCNPCTTSQEFDFTVPSGTTALTVRTGNVSDPGSDIDLYLFQIVGGNAIPVANSASSSPFETITVAAPAAGDYAALVLSFDIPNAMTYTLTDVFASPNYGNVTSTDVPAVHNAGTSWTATASTKALASPGTGRFLQGFVQVVTGTTVLAASEVDLKNVS